MNLKKLLMYFHAYFTLPTLTPIVYLTTAFILGILWQTYEFQWYITTCIMAITLVILVLLVRNSYVFKPLYSLAYCMFFLAGSVSLHTIYTNQKSFCLTTNGCFFNIVGKVTDIDTKEGVYLRYTITLQLVRLYEAHSLATVPITKKIITIKTNSCRELYIADTIFIKNVYFKTPSNKSYMDFLLKEGIITSITIINTPIDVLQRPHYSFVRWQSRYKDYLINTFKQEMDHETFLGFASIFLGNPQAKKQEHSLKKNLQTWGLFHYIARAGLHLVVFISIWIFFLGLLPIPWGARQIVLIIACSLYFLFTWPSIPFNRAFLTFILVRISNLFNIRTYYTPSLALVALVTLIYNPIYIFSLDFQLSFGVTCALAFFNEIRHQGQ